MFVCPLKPEQILQLKEFITACRAQPEIMHHPHMSFFKEYIESLGAVVPPLKEFTFETAGDSSSSTNAKPQEPAAADVSDESDAESVVELDLSGVSVSEPADAAHDMGDPGKECTDEERELADERRSAAVAAFCEQRYRDSVDLYTEAIRLNPTSALLFAKRGQVYLKMNKLHDCIKDCSHALELNCDSAAGYKFRGRAHSLLGQFEQANQDLCESLKIDYDDQTNEWLQAVKPNAEKLRQHKLSQQRNQEEKQHREKVRRARKAQEARAKAAREAAEATAAGGEDYGANMFGGGGNPFGAGGNPWGAPGTGGPQRGAPGGGFDPSNLAGLLMDPEIMAAFQDPEVAAAFGDVSSNPGNFSKYQNNPKVAAVIEKLQTKFGYAKGFPSFGGGAGGAPPSGPPPSGPPPSADDDVGLD